jgi:hypothetical protein
VFQALRPAPDDDEKGHEKQADAWSGVLFAAPVIDGSNHHKEGQSPSRQAQKDVRRPEVVWQDQADRSNDFQQADLCGQAPGHSDLATFGAGFDGPLEVVIGQYLAHSRKNKCTRQ